MLNQNLRLQQKIKRRCKFANFEICLKSIIFLDELVLDCPWTGLSLDPGPLSPDVLPKKSLLEAQVQLNASQKLVNISVGPLASQELRKKSH